jgi:hypothetical protein
MMNIERLTEEEYQAAMKAVNEIREEKARQAQVDTAKRILDQGITMMIELVGIEQTKALLREKNRELRKEE